jgi:hypothetical protein
MTDVTPQSQLSPLAAQSSGPLYSGEPSASTSESQTLPGSSSVPAIRRDTSKRKGSVVKGHANWALSTLKVLDRSDPQYRPEHDYNDLREFDLETLVDNYLVFHFACSTGNSRTIFRPCSLVWLSLRQRLPPTPMQRPPLTPMQRTPLMPM